MGRRIARRILTGHRGAAAAQEASENDSRLPNAGGEAFQATQRDGEGVHESGVIHRDIKPDNFIYDSINNKFKLIDYGLSKPYIISGKHIDENNNGGRCGTMRYMSINAHLKKTLSRKDDMISLSYSLIYLYCKKLPWQGIKEEKTEIHNKIVDLKKNFNMSFKDYNIIEPLLYLYNYSTNLKFDSKPDYSFLIQYFYKSLKNNSYKYNGKWSWYSELN